MPNIWISSDYHFFHNREFVYKPRGFSNVDEMNKAIIERHNAIVQPEDEVYVLGDLMLNDNEGGINCIKQLKGHLHIILGNHDTPTRESLYRECENVVDVALAARLKYRGYHFFMTHYPCLTGNLEKESLRQCTLSLFGHTHQQTNFFNDLPYMFHAGVDSHNCTPVLLDNIIEEMEQKVKECQEML